MCRHAHAGAALTSADAERTEPESPVFDEAFALDAQLILGSMVTPGTAARPPPQRQAAPLEQVPEVRGLSMSLRILQCEEGLWIPLQGSQGALEAPSWSCISALLKC